MPEPLHVFVASSSEQIEVAHAVAATLTDGTTVVAHPWDQDIFTFSDTYIESLERELDRADFAVVVLTADDAANVRQRTVNLPRDNVIFELGLFIGRLGRQRSFFFVDARSDTTIASDLSGVKPVRFRLEDEDAAGSRTPTIAVQAQKVLAQMLTQGPRHKPTEAAQAARHELWRFSNRIAGCWWERMRQGEDDKSALSFVTIPVDDVTGGPVMRGDAFGLDGETLGAWQTVTTAVTLGRRPRILYYWEGNHEDALGQVYGGAGLAEFDDGELLTARGHYYDTNFAFVGNGAQTRVKRFGLSRCGPEDVEIMRRPGSAAATRLVKKRLGTLSGR
ncbi:MAG: nucleotide-binding protein [Vicinamibacterales bacterium]